MHGAVLIFCCLFFMWFSREKSQLDTTVSNLTSGFEVESQCQLSCFFRRGITYIEGQLESSEMCDSPKSLAFFLPRHTLDHSAHCTQVRRCALTIFRFYPRESCYGEVEKKEPQQVMEKSWVWRLEMGRMGRMGQPNFVSFPKFERELFLELTIQHW